MLISLLSAAHSIYRLVTRTCEKGYYMRGSGQSVRPIDTVQPCLIGSQSGPEQMQEPDSVSMERSLTCERVVVMLGGRLSKINHLHTSSLLRRISVG